MTPDLNRRYNEFASFMQAYQDMVFSTAARLTGNDAQAEDIAQEVFLKAYEHFADLQNSPTAGGWLKTVATNLTLNHLSRYRKRWRFFSELRPADDEDDTEVGWLESAVTSDALPDVVLEGIAAEQRHALIEAAIQQLPDHQRVPLVLFHFEDMPYETIAEHLRVSLSKVKTDIYRARATLAKSLQRAGMSERQMHSNQT